jgi:hypothetical protein
MAERDWVKAIGRKLREDLGDCPTLPPEMQRLLERLGDFHADARVGDEADAARATPSVLPRTKPKPKH